MTLPRDFARAHARSLTTALVAVVVAQFYWVATSFAFLNFDDPAYVTENPVVARGLSADGVRWAFTARTQGHWHPLTWLSHMLDASLFGLDPFGHHLTNVLLFAAGAAALFAFLADRDVPLEAAFLGALFFALHPLRAESVAWVAERKDVLSFALGLGAAIAWHRGSPRLSWAALAASLLAKPTFVSLPPLLVLSDRAAGVRRPWRAYLPGFALAAASCALALRTQEEGGAIQPLDLAARLGTMAASYGAYLGKFVLPLRLSIFHPWRPTPAILACALLTVLAVLTALGFRARGRHPRAWFGWTWFLVTALPVSGAVPVGGQLYADRWTLVPHVGLLLALLSFFHRPHWARTAIGFAAVAAMATLAHANLPAWRDSEAVFRHALAVDPENFMAHTNLGAALAVRGEYAAAERHYAAAARLRPGYAEAQNNLGTALARRGRYDAAIEHFRSAVALAPRLSSARYNLGLAYVGAGRAVDGATTWIALLRDDPDYGATRASLRALRGTEPCPPADADRLGAVLRRGPFGAPTDGALAAQAARRACGAPD